MGNNEKIPYLKKMGAKIRANIIEMIPPGKVGHLGGSSSIADVLSVLYFDHMKGIDPANLKNPDRDRLVFSKGHAVLAQYAALVELGFFPREELAKVKTLGSVLQGHPDIDKTPGIEAVGIEPTASDSLSALRVGGIAVWIGNAQKMIEVNMQKIVTSELTIRGNYIYSFKEFGEALKLLESKKVDVSPLMTDRYPLEDGAKAFKDLENNKEGKMLKVFLENE